MPKRAFTVETSPSYEAWVPARPACRLRSCARGITASMGETSAQSRSAVSASSTSALADATRA
jgi:hypothetical protein